MRPTSTSRRVLHLLLALGATQAVGSRVRSRRRDAAEMDPASLSQLPPVEKPLQRDAALRLLRRVNVLDDDGAWSLDIGGSLAKVAFFRRHRAGRMGCDELLQGVGGRCANLAAESLTLPSLGGDVHFVLFQTRYIEDCIDFVDEHWVKGQRSSPLVPQRHPITMRATGGGSHKYRSAFSRIGVELDARDEMRSMVHGLNFLVTSVEDEVFSVESGDPLSKISPQSAASLQRRYLAPTDNPFPYLFVSFGSGVSIIEVTGWGPDDFRRVDGSSIGGGTFWGLCRLLLQCDSFDDLIALTERGVSSNVDMLVGDIYGGDCESRDLDKDVIAASFGKVIMRQSPAVHSRDASRLEGFGRALAQVPILGAVHRARRARARVANRRLSQQFRAEDVALSLLRMVSNNVGQVRKARRARSLPAGLSPHPARHRARADCLPQCTATGLDEDLLWRVLHPQPSLHHGDDQ